MANGTLKVSNIETSSGSGTITLGQSGETVTVASGATNNLGITEADQWRTTTSTLISAGSDVLLTDFERVDTDGGGKIGTGMTHSSGTWTFPSTGVYLILTNLGFASNSTNGSNFVINRIYTTTDNGTYDKATSMSAGKLDTHADAGLVVSSNFQFDVTDTSTHKVRFYAYTQTGCYITGNTGRNQSDFTFIRLGDT